MLKNLALQQEKGRKDSALSLASAFHTFCASTLPTCLSVVVLFHRRQSPGRPAIAVPIIDSNAVAVRSARPPAQKLTAFHRRSDEDGHRAMTSVRRGPSFKPASYSPLCS
ncbi:hypothetical protein AAFF_G00227130 [Aldrovandia affinis]|uniref:Uncharacterized protein n=1 Tax=Aldrovandia affinis TaxID=143900 RepID=A0AAD7X2G9_9TELE|nr:hypothetical protein AAFF_G00227130 [Aldrovandia affinis]